LPSKKPEEIYPTIPKERAIALAELVRKIELQNELSADKGGDQESKFRNRAREKFTCALVF